MQGKKIFMLFSVATVLCVGITMIAYASLHRGHRSVRPSQNAALPVVKHVKNRTKSIEVVSHETVMKAGIPVILITMRNKSDEFIKAVTLQVSTQCDTSILSGTDYVKQGLAPGETITESFSLLGLGSDDTVTIIGAEVGVENYEGDEEGILTVRGMREHDKKEKAKREGHK